jgi:hypothetical protein
MLLPADLFLFACGICVTELNKEANRKQNQRQIDKQKSVG